MNCIVKHSAQLNGVHPQQHCTMNAVNSNILKCNMYRSLFELYSESDSRPDYLEPALEPRDSANVKSLASSTVCTVLGPQFSKAPECKDKSVQADAL